MAKSQVAATKAFPLGHRPTHAKVNAPVRLADGATDVAAIASPSIALQQMVAESLHGTAAALPSAGDFTPLQKVSIWLGLSFGLWALIGLAIYAAIGWGHVA